MHFSAIPFLPPAKGKAAQRNVDVDSHAKEQSMAKLTLYLPDGKMISYNNVSEVGVENGALSFKVPERGAETSYATKKLITTLPYLLHE
jgi:hypothetical protein